MFTPFICGSFQNQEDQDIIDTFSPCSTPKRSRRGSGSYRNKENKNRYSNLGLDKFNALLSEIEEKKKKIYTQKGAEDIALVHFVISSDNEIKPVVVKVKGKRASNASPSTSSRSTTNILQVSEQLKKNTENQESSSNKKMEVEKIPNDKMGYARWDFVTLDKFRQPFYYLPVLVIFILLFLALYGRPFAILCTSIGWYLIPLLRGDPSSNPINSPRRLKRTKEHSRRLSERTFGKIDNKDNGSSSPTSVFNGPAGVLPPRQLNHRRSW